MNYLRQKIISALIFVTVTFFLTGCDEDKLILHHNLFQEMADPLHSDSSGGFSRAYRARQFSFPLDYAAHLRYKKEKWFFSGNLKSTDGREFGYQLTFYRIGLKPNSYSVFSANLANEQKPIGSKWRSNHIYMAHLSVSDIKSNQFYSFERLNRKALGLAGSSFDETNNQSTQNEKLRIWVEDWSASTLDKDVFPIKLSASDANISINLKLNAAKPAVLNGNKGLMYKGRKAGNAAYSYSITRLPSLGEITVKGKSYKVQGESWFDREWSTAALGQEFQGWDWFTLQLTDQRELMFYALRHPDQSIDGLSSGIIVNKDGKARSFANSSIRYTTIKHWVSPHTGIKYPSAWRLNLFKDNIEVTITPKIADQEIRATTRLWQGAVEAVGRNTATNVALKGHGYVELVGYR